MSTSIDPHLFISYASVDRTAVMPVADRLLGAGLPVWIDQMDIPGAAAYGAEIGAAIRRCRALVLCCSPASLVSPNVKQELMLAWKYQRPYLPLIIQWTTIPPDLEYWLEGVQWIEVVDRPSERWLPEILRALDRLETNAAATVAPARVEGGGPVGLPHPLTEILGRESDVAEVAGLLAVHRLVTLTGPGGTGKTRLAIAAAHAVSAEFGGGAAFVDLSPVSDPELVGPMVARALGIRGTPQQSTFEAIKAGLGGSSPVGPRQL